MKIHKFDTRKGIYQFELNEIETDFHSHPTFEILLSEKSKSLVSAHPEFIIAE